ncbi:MAG: caspase family protein [Geminicoccaceae bacterium]
MSAERVALVVGNQDYAALPDLPNAAADARLVAARLERVGFTVTLATDLDRAGMARAVAHFTAAASGKEAALLYFAGHGVQVDGVNWLLPTSALVGNRDDLARQGLALDRLLADLRNAGPEVGIVVLDACRDNPLGALPGAAPVGAARSVGTSRGLARTGAPTGLFIAYATAPGQVAFDGPPGGNGPFARALATLIEQPGLEISILFRRVREQVMAMTAGLQQPWSEDSLTRELYLVPPDPATPDPLRRLNAALAEVDPWRRAAGLAELARSEPTNTPGRVARSELAQERARLARARPAPEPLGAVFADRHRLVLLAGTPAEPIAREAYAVLHGAPPPVERRARGFRPATGGSAAPPAPAATRPATTTAAETAAGPSPDLILWPLVERAGLANLVERFLQLFPTSAHAEEARLLLSAPGEATPPSNYPAPPPADPAAGALSPAAPTVASATEPQPVAPAPVPLTVHLGTGPRPLPLPVGPVALADPLESGRILATLADGRSVELGPEPLAATALVFVSYAYTRDRVELVRLTGPDGAPALELELSIATHPCDLEAGSRFDTQGVALGRYPNEVEPEAAITTCRAAVEAYPEVPRLRGQLGRALVLAGRYAEGVVELEAAQARGHLASRWLLGSLLVDGRGVAADPARGVALLESAAEQGNPGAMNELGRLHLRGVAVPEDRDRAVEWLERAAAAGHTFAYNNLGNLLLQEGATARARELFTASAEAGDIFGYNNLGWLYETGKGVARDLPNAVGWYARAAEAGQPNAFINLGRLLREGGPGLPPDPDWAAYWLAAAAERGNIWGHVQLARLQLSGTLGAKEEGAAARLLARAATARLDRLPMALRSGITAAYHDEAQAAARAELAKLPQTAMVRAIQEELASRGLDPGGRDGRLGPKTRAAIASFARSQNPPLPAEAPLWRVLGALLEPAT